MAQADPRRAKDLARIHLAKKELGLDEETYRSLLVATTGKASAGELAPGERWKLLCELGRMGAASGGPVQFPGKPVQVPFASRALMTKIEAYLAEAKRPWAYAHGMAQKMFKRARIQDCDPEELRRIVAALEYDARRHGRA